MKINLAVGKNQEKDIGTNSHGEVFISYAVADRDLAMRIHSALESAGQSVWIDSEDIRYADNWKEAVLPAIEQAPVILFITSKASTSSKNCLDELDYSEKMGKRIIPIVAERVDIDTVPDTLRERVRRDFRDLENFHTELLKLIQDITSEPKYVQLHTHLAIRAARWHTEKLGLLDSGEVKIANKWMEWAKSNSDLEPRPTEFVTEFITASKNNIKKQRLRLFSAFLVIIAAIGVYFGVQWWNSMPRAGIRPQIQGDETTQVRTTEGIARLNEYLDTAIPSKSDRQRLLIATWHIRNLGRSQRSDEPLHYIAEIISHFDIVAIQDVQDNPEHYNRILDILGPGWKSAESDINEGRSGNRERLVFLYDSRKITPNGLIGELVVTDEEQAISQPARSPYFVGFSFEGTDIVFCNVHIILGKRGEDKNRLIEIDAIASQLALKTERGQDFPPNLVLLGDMQGGSLGGQILEAIEDAGFVLPPEIRDLPTNTSSQGKPYDQIALMLSPSLELEPGASGVIDYYQFVYTDEQAELYMADDDWATDRFDFRRTFWMSDHLPKWVSLKVHEEAE